MVSITWGSQNCRGGIPDFISIETVIISLLILMELSRLTFEKSRNETTMIIEAPAWMIKYLIADLEDLILILFIKRGMNIIRLISMASHISAQDSEDTTTNGVKNKMK